jgi:TPP-dependent indolepyruvate ferredoxin oxidoreductase alpha subunit
MYTDAKPHPVTISRGDHLPEEIVTYITRRLILSSQYLLPDDYKSEIRPSWCPGCSVYGIMSALSRVFSKKQINPLTTNLISVSVFFKNAPLFKTFGMHTLHGRAIPVAVGSRLSRPDIETIVIGGDGIFFPSEQIILFMLPAKISILPLSVSTTESMP